MARRWGCSLSGLRSHLRNRAPCCFLRVVLRKRQLGDTNPNTSGREPGKHRPSAGLVLSFSAGHLCSSSVFGHDSVCGLVPRKPQVAGSLPNLAPETRPYTLVETCCGPNVSADEWRQSGTVTDRSAARRPGCALTPARKVPGDSGGLSGGAGGSECVGLPRSHPGKAARHLFAHRSQLADVQHLEPVIFNELHDYLASL